MNRIRAAWALSVSVGLVALGAGAWWATLTHERGLRDGRVEVVHTYDALRLVDRYDLAYRLPGEADPYLPLPGRVTTISTGSDAVFAVIDAPPTTCVFGEHDIGLRACTAAPAHAADRQLWHGDRYLELSRGRWIRELDPATGHELWRATTSGDPTFAAGELWLIDGPTVGAGRIDRVAPSGLERVTPDGILGAAVDDDGVVYVAANRVFVGWGSHAPEELALTDSTFRAEGRSCADVRLVLLWDHADRRSPAAEGAWTDVTAMPLGDAGVIALDRATYAVRWGRSWRSTNDALDPFDVRCEAGAVRLGHDFYALADGRPVDPLP